MDQRHSHPSLLMPSGTFRFSNANIPLNINGKTPPFRIPGRIFFKRIKFPRPSPLREFHPSRNDIIFHAATFLENVPGPYLFNLITKGINLGNNRIQIVHYMFLINIEDMFNAPAQVRPFKHIQEHPLNHRNTYPVVIQGFGFSQA